MQKSYVTSGGGEARQALQWCMSTLWKLSLETLLNIQDRHVSVYQYFYNTSWNTKQNKADDTFEVVGEWGVFFGDIYCLQQLCAEA